MSPPIDDPEDRLKPLVKPLPPEDDYQGRLDHWKRKLGYKMPITLRYGATFGFASGFLVGLYKKSVVVMAKHTLIGTVVGGIGLCYNELSQIAKYTQLVNNSKK